MSGMNYSEFKDDPKKALMSTGFNKKVIKLLRNTNRSVASVRQPNSNKGILARRAVLINHYINGKNHWEYRFNDMSDLSYYYTGETFDKLKPAEYEIGMIINDEGYIDYIRKFNHHIPIADIHFPDNFNYNMMPKPERKDNKDVRVGSGGGSNGGIRFPKRNRGKATWKKFWKLFPMLNGYKSMLEYQVAVREKYKLETQKMENEEIG